jgi:hypothetical protein
MAGRSDTCQFSAWADSQGGWDTFAPLVDLMARQPTDFSVGIGDLVNDGSDPAQWAGFAQRLAPLAARTAIVAIPGNHDYDGYYDDLRSPTFDAWFRFGGEPTWTSWSCGPARFAAIDVNQQFPIGLGAAQAAWLEREVTSAPWRTASWRVLMVHQPPWSRSWPGYDGDRVVRDLVERLSRDAALDVVVSGHSHAYERTVRRVAGRELHAFITGGAGGGLEPASVAALDTPDWRVVVRHHVLLAEARPGTLHFRAVDAAGTTIDEVTIRR